MTSDPQPDPAAFATQTAESRRTFIKQAAVAAALGMGPGVLAATGASARPGSPPAADPVGPWYRRAIRWGQTNITELDPTRYDIDWWRQHWKRTHVQGVVVNAGGIVAYYPSEVPLHHRAEFLRDRDLFGELTRAAHEDGLAVFARMDSNSTREDFFRAHPDWFTRDATGRPYRNRELYITCVNSPYYDEHLPAVLREIATRYHPEGFTDNSWSGLGRNSFCYCANCERKFHERSGAAIPRAHNWNDPIYRQWIEWNYARRLEIWDQNNRVTRAAGGPHCLWVGMNGGNLAGQSGHFRDFKAICERAEMIMLDDQRRQNDTGFQRNGQVGKLVHGLLGWEKIMPESMAMYQSGTATFRLSAKPAAEARMWMLAGFAGGIQPWWHHVGAYQEDRRQFRTAEPIMQWHRANEQFLVNRRPIATVAVGWSQRNLDFFGREDPALHVDLPANGVMHALVRSRIPYLPVHLDHLDRDADQFRTLILPNVAAMSEAQVGAVRRFVRAGGGLVATGHASLCDEYGDTRADYGLADLFGVHLPPAHGARQESTRRRWAADTSHSYLRLAPELRARAPGPHPAGEPPAVGDRHPVLRGFDETDLLPFGGVLEPLQVDGAAAVLATYCPPFPAFPPELSWMRQPKTEIAGLVLNEQPGRGRVAFLPADLDRRYARENLPDHGDLLANLVRWTARDDIPLSVAGPGMIDCHLYRQANRLILHLLNLTSAGTWRAPVEEYIPVGPIGVRVRLPSGVGTGGVRLLVSTKSIRATRHGDWTEFTLPSIVDHEMVVIE